MFEHFESLLILKLIFVLGKRVLLYWAQIQLFIVLMSLFLESIKLLNTNSYIRRHYQEYRGTQGIEDILGL